VLAVSAIVEKESPLVPAGAEILGHWPVAALTMQTLLLSELDVPIHLVGAGQDAGMVQ